MLTMVIQVDALPEQAMDIKETAAMSLERYGDTRVISVTETKPEQMTMFAQRAAPAGGEGGQRGDR